VRTAIKGIAHYALYKSTCSITYLLTYLSNT